MAAASIQLLDKVQLLLGAFEAEQQTLGLSELAQRSGVPKGTTHRLCEYLTTIGVLERTDGKAYQLGMRLFEWGQLVPRQRILRRASLPVMLELMRSTGEMVHLGVRTGTRVMYIESMAATRHESILANLSPSMPLHCTSTGKALLAAGPSQLVDELLAGRRLERWTRHTIVHPQRFRLEIERCRARGYAVETEEARLGYLSTAASIALEGAGPVGALSITAPTHRADLDRLVRLIQRASEQITAELADSHHPQPRLRSIG